MRTGLRTNCERRGGATHSLSLACFLLLLPRDGLGRDCLRLLLRRNRLRLVRSLLRLLEGLLPPLHAAIPRLDARRSLLHLAQLLPAQHAARAALDLVGRRVDVGRLVVHVERRRCEPRHDLVRQAERIVVHLALQRRHLGVELAHRDLVRVVDHPTRRPALPRQGDLAQRRQRRRAGHAAARAGQPGVQAVRAALRARAVAAAVVAVAVGRLDVDHALRLVHVRHVLAVALLRRQQVRFAPVLVVRHLHLDLAEMLGAVRPVLGVLAVLLEAVPVARGGGEAERRVVEPRAVQAQRVERARVAGHSRQAPPGTSTANHADGRAARLLGGRPRAVALAPLALPAPAAAALPPPARIGSADVRQRLGHSRCCSSGSVVVQIQIKFDRASEILTAAESDAGRRAALPLAAAVRRREVRLPPLPLFDRCLHLLQLPSALPAADRDRRLKSAAAAACSRGPAELASYCAGAACGVWCSAARASHARPHGGHPPKEGHTVTAQQRIRSETSERSLFSWLFVLLNEKFGIPRLHRTDSLLQAVTVLPLLAGVHVRPSM